jgi:hypothetical protein
MAADRTISEPESAGVGPPPRDLGRGGEILLVELAKLQSDGEYLKRDLSETRTDMREIRDRMARLETEFKHLPSKEFIVTVVVIALGIGVSLLTVAPQLQKWAGTAPQAVSAPSPTR